MKYLLLFCMASASFHCSPKLSPDHDWNGVSWTLVEMKGVPVQQSGSSRDAFLTFHTAEKKFSGNGGCNLLNGQYSLDKDDIRFSNIASTKRSCSDIEFENTFLQLLGEVDNFDRRGEDIVLKKRRESLLVLRPRNR